MKIKRREFIRSATALTAGGIMFGDAKSSFANSSSIPTLIKIDTPFHGAILNSNHGIEVDNGLKIRVEGEAPLGSTVTVNGTPAKLSGTKFYSEIILRDKETKIIAETKGWFGENNQNIRVLWDKNSFPRYGFEIDDNIFFYRDIARNKYKSLFDCFYLKGLRDLNRKYGAKFVLNSYYSDGLEYTDEKEFTLDQFPDKYKNEWIENSDWLRLTFHANSNMPDRPYQFATPEKLIADFDKVYEQIIRFAGEETFISPSIVHWGMVQPSAYKPLFEKGVRVLRGYFSKASAGGYDVNHNLDNFRSEYLSRNYALKDFDSGIIFERVDMVINSTPIDEIVPKLETTHSDPNLKEVIDLMTHEQYFWKFYPSYIPDHFERLDRALSWVTENGYKPIFLHESFPEVSG